MIIILVMHCISLFLVVLQTYQDTWHNLKLAHLKLHSVTFSSFLFSCKTFFACQIIICTIHQAISHTYLIKRVTGVVSSLPRRAQLSLRVSQQMWGHPSSFPIACGCGWQVMWLLARMAARRQWEVVIAYAQHFPNDLRLSVCLIRCCWRVSASSLRRILVHEN